ncbi:hypothetical protein HNO88_000267 [Novosphingobium chloroacetimidivorans]|uniref:Uncharacterized protein n=1 Tax=Novosphingobium chloroacetimidivorans TaxID=1428314 RepID=A0A7W7NVB9_9SPHN|nr:hypothetical protein [Novosphingobium chloroacetimidivorans]MBB4856970.1 hypothetical protein [Novosphingobium chloroacetimidivorans]
MTLQELLALTGDKYSPNLRKWLVQARFGGALPTVYTDKDACRWIGWIDEETWFIGTRLAQVLGRGRRAEIGCWTFPVSDLSPLDGFWKRYAEIGRCAIDTAHASYFIGEDTRWQVDGDRRDCLWCGDHTQTLKRWTEEVEREAWVEATPPMLEGAR